MSETNSKSFLIEPPTTWASRLIFIELCAAIVLTTLGYGTVHPSLVGLFWLSAALLVVLWAADAFLSGALRFSRSWLQIPLIGAILFGLVQIIPFGLTNEVGVQSVARTISYDPYQTQLAVWHFAALLIFFAAALSFVDSPQRLKFLALFITIFGFLFSFYAIIQNLLDPGRIYGFYERPFMQPFGSFVNKHNFAAYIEMCAAVPLGLLFSGAIAREKRLLYLTATGLMGIALVMSGSRGGLVALLAELVFLAVIATKNRTPGALFVKIGLAAALVAAIAVGTVLIGGDSTLTRIAETAGSKDPTSSRLQIWATTLDVIKQNPLFGVGWGAFGVAYTQFDPLNGRERVEQSHNDYLQILADAGIVGAILGAAFVFALFRDGWRRIGSDDNFRRGIAIGALAGCFAILVHSLFDFVLHTTAISLLFLTLAALATLNGRVEAEENLRPKRRRASVTSIDSKRRKTEAPALLEE
ncbi:MAG: O-antigen ligase family protein [Pyrinomonadaceae bacterium]